MKYAFLSLVLLTGMYACNNKVDAGKKTTATEKTEPKKQDSTSTLLVADAATIIARKEVPVLCYHHIKDGSKSEYTVTPANFAAQMQMLADSGYKSILPDQLYEYLAKGIAIPEKSVMITFDDTDLEQFTIGKAEMDKHGFKGVFFIMTISMNRPRYMSKEQIKQLSDEGNVIACHTWDHHMVTKYVAEDWDKQLVVPQKKLEEITGKPIHYFAYPFGLWNQAAIPELKNRGYKLAFSLATKRDTLDPLYTVRRIIVAGQWSAPGMLRAMKGSFR